jgi:2-hydroxychromene-2-carboxylate isomerase
MAGMQSTPSTQPPDTVRFYFSFRSPYGWLAMHRVEAVLGVPAPGGTA